MPEITSSKTGFHQEAIDDKKRGIEPENQGLTPESRAAHESAESRLKPPYIPLPQAPGQRKKLEQEIVESSEVRRIKVKIRKYLQEHANRFFAVVEVMWRHHPILSFGETHGDTPKIAALIARVLDEFARPEDIVVIERAVEQQEAVDQFLAGNNSIIELIYKKDVLIRQIFPVFEASRRKKVQVVLVDSRPELKLHDPSYADPKWDADFLRVLNERVDVSKLGGKRVIIHMGKAHALWYHSPRTAPTFVSLLAQEVGYERIVTFSLEDPWSGAYTGAYMHTLSGELFRIDDLLKDFAGKAVPTGLKNTPFRDCRFAFHEKLAAESTDLISILA